MDALITENRRKNEAWRAAGAPRGQAKDDWLRENPEMRPTAEEKRAIKGMQEKYPGLARGAAEGLLQETIKTNEERLKQLRVEKQAAEGLIGLFDRARVLLLGTPAGIRELQEQESEMEYRLNFLGKKRREVEASRRNMDRGVPAASLESSAAYEALARSRMAADPQTDLLQKIVREEEKATTQLEKIREQLDPGRAARIAILETLE